MLMVAMGTAGTVASRGKSDTGNAARQNPSLTETQKELRLRHLPFKRRGPENITSSTNLLTRKSLTQFYPLIYLKLKDPFYKETGR